MCGDLASCSAEAPFYDEPRRNGNVPKILTHMLYPQAQYNIWIDGNWK